MSDRTRCSIPGCEKDGRLIRGWCWMHYSRWHRHGDPLVRLKGDHEPWLASSGYMTTAKPHALSKGGRVYVHRATLYDAIGPGLHPCYWCGTLLTWDDNPTDSPASALCVDHVDGDRLNNDRANLVPSRTSCNSLRRNGHALTPMP